MNIKNKKICIVGLGYVGLTMAIKMAEIGFLVIGVEKNKEILNSLNKKKSHFFEPGLDDKIAKLINKRFFIYEKINIQTQADIYIITVGTPLDKNGKFRIDFIKNVSENLTKVVKNGDLVILRSTVIVGTTRKIVYPILRKFKNEINLAYCPERTQEGSALKELSTLPQIISGLNLNSIKIAENLFKTISKKIIRMSSLESAELLKIVDNTYRDSSFAFANEIALISSKLGLSAKEIISSGKKDYQRTNIPLPGPVGGPCLAKDTYILNESLKLTNFRPKISLVSRKLNEKLPNHICKDLKKYFKQKKFNKFKIALLGFAFKGNPPTSDLRGSTSYLFYQNILKFFKKSLIYGHDPVVSNFILKKNFCKKIIFEKNIFKVLKNTNMVIIMNNHLEYKKLNINKCSKLMKKNSIIFDCWGMHGRKKNFDDVNQKVKYIPFGDL